MIVDFQSLSPKEIYSIMIQCIVPRPIAWILSDSGGGRFNLAPFSYFNGVTSRPPLISVSIGKKSREVKKDTWLNIEERDWFVVHVPPARMASPVSLSAASLPHDQSELDGLDLHLVEEEGWPLPRIEEIGVALLCKRYQIIEVGEGPQGLVLGEVQSVYVDSNLIEQSAKNNAIKLSLDRFQPLARLGGDEYAGLNASFTVERPD